jgi:hypothetical protein
MSVLSLILSRGAAQLVENIGEAFDANFTSKEEKLEARNALMEQAASLTRDLQDARSRLVMAEISGNWIQRSWRPIVMLLFAWIVFYAYFIQPAFFPGAFAIAESLNDNFWGLLKIGMGGYLVGRSAEKVAMKVSDNVNLKKPKRRNNE